jgi:hypothetical protein
VHALATNPRSHFVTAVQVAPQELQGTTFRFVDLRTSIVCSLTEGGKFDVLHACLNCLLLLLLPSLSVLNPYSYRKQTSIQLEPYTQL